MKAMKDYLSLVPGPTQVHEDVLKAQSRQILTHMNEAWTPYYLSVCDKMKLCLGASGDVYLATCSGSGAVEAAVTSTVAPGEKLLVLSNGLFGDRFGVIADHFHLEKEVMRYANNQVLKPEDLRARLSQGKGNIAAVSAVYSESQNGMLNPVKELAAICNEFDVPILVDTVSATGGVPYNADAWGVDVTIASLQKCLGGTAGTAAIAVADKYWHYVENKDTLGYYHSLKFWRENMHMENPVHPHPFTMSESLIFGTDAACDLILKEGLENRWKRHREVFEYYVEALGKLGFHLYLPYDCACPTCISFAPHEKISVPDMLLRLKEEHGILVGNGIADQKNKIWRIGNMAEQARMEKAEKLVAAMRQILDTL